jgi:hypothetical protein
MMTASQPIRWAIVDDTAGAPCADGTVLTQAIMQNMALAVTIQLCRDLGCEDSVRVAADVNDIQPGERVFAFRNGLPEAPGALAYHSIDGVGVEFGMGDWASCSSAIGAGPSGSGAFSHEALETRGDRACNGWADDGAGSLHATERCDAVEVQSYAITLDDGTQVFVSDFLYDAWWIPGAPGPYSYCAAAGLAPDCPGPFQTAPGNGGNYQVIAPSPTASSQIFASIGFPGVSLGDVVLKLAEHGGHAGPHIHGTPRNPAKAAHWSSRTYRRGVRG